MSNTVHLPWPTVKAEALRAQVKREVVVMAKQGQKWFREPVVLAIGELCNFKARVGVDREEVIQRVIENTGVDPEEYTEGLSLKRIIGFAHRNQRPSYRKSHAYTLSISPTVKERDDSGNWRKKGNSALWGLTEDGAKVAKELAGKTSASSGGGGGGGGGGIVKPDSVETDDPVTPIPKANPVVVPDSSEEEDIRQNLKSLGEGLEALQEEVVRNDYLCQAEEVLDILEEESATLEEQIAEPNLTAQWIGEHYNEAWEIMLGSVRRHWRRSAELGLAEDHVSNYLTDLMGRDGLRSHILDPDFDLRPQHLASWCCQDVISQQMGWGTDPTCREIRGSRTRLDLEGRYEFKPDPDVLGRLVWSSKDTSHMSWDLVDNAHEDILDQAAFDDAMSVLENMLRDTMRDTAADRYIGILRRMVHEQHSIMDVAEYEDVSRNRAASMIRRLRVLARSEFAGGGLLEDYRA